MLHFLVIKLSLNIPFKNIMGKLKRESNCSGNWVKSLHAYGIHRPNYEALSFWMSASQSSQYPSRRTGMHFQTFLLEIKYPNFEYNGTLHNGPSSPLAH